MRKFGTRMSWAFLVMVVLTGTGYGMILTADQAYVFLPGVDRNGNPDSNLGTFCTGKVYKDTRTGILYAAADGYVWNLSHRPALFLNVSYNINDPWARESHQATTDEIHVSLPNYNGVNGASLATARAVYIP